MTRTALWCVAAVALFSMWTAGTYRLGNRNCAVFEKVTVDTVVVREVVRDTVLVPRVHYVARVDTVYLTLPGDTVKVAVEVPVERKVYHTEDYRATVEGFRPRLVEMELYRRTEFITRTETVKVPDRRRWGVGVQAGYGYGPGGFRPYAGIGVQYSVFTW